MNLKANILAALLYLRGRNYPEMDYQVPMDTIPDFKETYLDLPDHVTPVKLTQEGYVTEPSGYVLPHDTADIYRDLMNTKEWFSPVLKHLNEEEWVLIICNENYQKAFSRRIRMKELKFKILRRKP